MSGPQSSERCDQLVNAVADEVTTRIVFKPTSGSQLHSWPFRRALAGLGLVAGVLLLLFIRANRDHASLDIVPLATHPGWERDPSFSPDGNQITFDYVDENSDGPDIYVR